MEELWKVNKGKENEGMEEVQLKKWELKDKRALMEICNAVDRSYLTNRIPSPYEERDALLWIDKVQDQDGKEGIFRAITWKGKVIGNISIEKKEDVFQKDCEMGYFLLKEYWSLGIMTEAVAQICKIAWDQLDIIRISALVYSPNLSSSKVLEKNGFQLEGRMKNAVAKDNHIYDLLIFGKQKDTV